MNILDIAVLVLFAFFILAGWYRGFVNTVLSLGAFILAIALAFVMRPLVSNAVKGNEWLYNTALYYTEGAEFVDNVELAQTAVSNISADELNAVMDNATLPIPMAQRITENVASEAFAADGLSTLDRKSVV